MLDETVRHRQRRWHQQLARGEGHAHVRLGAAQVATVEGREGGTLQLDGVVVRKFVSLLDGSRDQRMLLDAMNAFLDETRAAGITVPGLPERATAEEVAMHLKDVARLGLLRA